MTDIPAADRHVAAADNRPALITPVELAVDHNDLEITLDHLERQASAQPHAINSDTEQGDLQDVIKLLDDFAKHVEATREGVKAPYLAATRTIDGFFKQHLSARIISARDRLARIGGDYLRRKEAAERSRREAEARRLRDEELKRRAEAEAAERKAQAQRDRGRSSTDAEINANTADNIANAIGSAAWQAEQLAKARPAELARTRSGAGSLGTLQSFWDFEIVDAEALAQAAIIQQLWPYIARAEKEKAIRAFIRSNAPETSSADDWQPLLPAIQMVRNTKPQFR